MSQQLQITGGAKVRDLQDVIIGTSGVLSSLAFNVANGVPKLDSNGKILVSQLPNSVMEYQGTWNANTNTPTLVNGTGNQGDFYLCNVAGTTNFGAGPLTFAVGDSAIYSGSIWQKAGGATGTVTSVGLTSTGNDAITITGSPITTSGNINLGFAGTNLQYINGTGDLTTFPTLISSIGLTMPSAFSVANSPLTANGTIAVTGAGYPSQYIRGDGTLADFPTSGGGGSSVSYYLNGGTSQGTIGGVTYYEMSKTADTGTGVDFPKTGDGLIVSFLTDANDPAQLNIPAGNWNYEIYASMSSNGGTPQLYAELYVYNGTTFTLISTSSNEILYDGVNLNLYTFAMTVPSTTLALTDRLAIKLYATNSGGKTTTVHTQDSHLCQIITTFSTGITALNGLTAQVQYFATGTSGSDFNISSTTATHTFNLPVASAANTGKLSSTDWSTFNGKVPYTGANANVDLGNFNFDANNISGGAIIAKLNGPASSPFVLKTGSSGYTIGDDAISLISSPNFANTLILASNIGVVTKTALIGLGSLTANRTFTLPDLSGTLALTSDLSAYLSLIGGTLTGNLYGTFIFANNQFSVTKNSVGGSTAFYGLQQGAGTNRWNIAITDVETGSNAGFNFNIDRYADSGTILGTALLINRATGNAIFSNNVTAASLIKSGGTSSQFLKADGSVDSNTYLTTSLAASTYIPYTGATGAVNLGAYDLLVNGLTIGRGGGNVAVNTVLGYQALNSGTSTQNDQNTAIGYRALFSNTLGQYNTSVGYQSLYSNVSGSSNSALGWYSLYFNTGANNTATGYRALYMNSSGGNNTAIGRSALDQNSTGSYNIGIGLDSGYGTGTNYNTTGSNNIFIGYQSVGESSTASNRTWIGNTSTTSTWLGGNLLLGTRTDSGYRLDVTGTGRFTGALTSLQSNISSGSSSYGTWNGTTNGAGFLALQYNGTTYGWVGQGSALASGGSATDFAISYDNNLVFTKGASSTKMIINSSGNVGIGATPLEKLWVNLATNVNFAIGGTTRTRILGVVNANDNFCDISLEGSNVLFFSAGTERMRITSAGLITKTVDNTTTGQIQYGGQTGSPPNAILVGAADQNGPYPIGVKSLSNPTSQGLVGFFDYTNASQGSISISGTTVSYNSFMGSHWSQLSDNSKPEILKGTVLEAIDELCEWENEVNDRLAKIKISNTVESKNVYGIFLDWDNMDKLNDMYVAAVGAGFVRVNSNSIVSMGDLLQSNGDGTAKVQSDDIMRSSTIAKVVSTNKIETYEDGSYLIAATLHCG